MTIKQLFVLVETALSSYREVVNDQYLEDILCHYIMYKRDFSNRPDIEADSWIHFEYGKADSFDLNQLEEELPSGYSIYYYVTDLDDIVIEHFTDKQKAFKQFRELCEDILVIDKLLIDNSKGIIAGGKLRDDIKHKQYKSYIEWIRSKYPIGITIQFIQEYKSGLMEFHDRSSLVGKEGIIVNHDIYSSLIKVNFGRYGITQLEVGKDQFIIIKDNPNN